MSGPHRLVNPPSLPEPSGFAHAVSAAPGRTVYLGGQLGSGPDGRLVGPGLQEQFGRALDNVLEAMAAAGGRPEHLVSLQIFVRDAAEYRGALAELGALWRERLGRHYPALALLEVAGLFDPEARVELMGVAVVPDGG